MVVEAFLRNYIFFIELEKRLKLFLVPIKIAIKKQLDKANKFKEIYCN
jgi:hypothetical protein